jgi:hypothetical protein
MRTPEEIIADVRRLVAECEEAASGMRKEDAASFLAGKPEDKQRGELYLWLLGVGNDLGSTADRMQRQLESTRVGTATSAKRLF